MIESKPTGREVNAPSRIPVVTGETQSPTPVKKPVMTGASPTNSQQSTPTKRKLPTPGGVGQVAKEPPQTRTVQKEESRPQTMPREMTEDQDSEVYFINILILKYLTIFRRFPTIFRRFPNIFRMLSEGHTFPRKIRRCFDNIGKLWFIQH